MFSLKSNPFATFEMNWDTKFSFSFLLYLVIKLALPGAIRSSGILSTIFSAYSYPIEGRRVLEFSALSLISASGRNWYGNPNTPDILFILAKSSVSRLVILLVYAASPNILL